MVYDTKSKKYIEEKSDFSVAKEKTRFHPILIVILLGILVGAVLIVVGVLGLNKYNSILNTGIRVNAVVTEVNSQGNFAYMEYEVGGTDCSARIDATASTEIGQTVKIVCNAEDFSDYVYEDRLAETGRDRTFIIVGGVLCFASVLTAAVFLIGKTRNNRY